MNDPRSELVGCIKAFSMAATPAVQRAAIYKYFAPDAGFLHPLCSVKPGPGSRETILGIYQWYRDMSPTIEAEVNSFTYDEHQNVAYLDVVQKFHIFVSPFQPKPARLLVKISLKQSKDNDKYYIVQQEDFYQPEDILYLTLPFLAPPFLVGKRLAGRLCSFNTWVFATLRGAVSRGMAFTGLD
ncbi:hypothetical protein M0805_002398 [Coniferiporia weirii]|nr:hypothetical protein M0805_002398 [Coniferiporia weirii]